MLKRYFSLFFGCLFTAAWVDAQPGQTTPTEPVIELPRFEVSADRVLPPLEKWKYVQVPGGYEVLSDSTRWLTADFVKEFSLLRQVIDVVLPAAKKTSALPTYIILSSEGNLYSRFIPKDIMDRSLSSGSPSMLVSDGERVGIVVRIDSRGAGVNSDDFSPSLSRVSVDEFVSITSGLDGDDDFVVKEDGSLALAGEALSFSGFYRQYFKDVMRRSFYPAEVPLWAEEGMAKIFEGVRFNRKTIDLGSISTPGFNIAEGNSILGPGKYGHHRLVAKLYESWIPGVTKFDPEKTLPTKSYGTLLSQYLPRNRDTQISPLTGQPLLARSQLDASYVRSDYVAAAVPLIPLDKFFAVKSVEDETPMLARIYSSQAYLFAHLCLHSIKPDHKGFREKYAKLVKLATEKPVEEKDFIACFGFGYDKMLAYMRSYSKLADFQRFKFDAKRGLKLQPVPEFEVREASDAESGRIAGEVLRMAGQNEVALERLIAPYWRGDRSPDLLAALGIAEKAANRTDRARKFLEKAVQEKTTRARAYAELARLRLDENVAKAQAEKRKFTPEEVQSVLSPVEQGLQKPPVMAEFYDVLAKVWTFAPSAPDAQQFGALLGGVRRYPDNLNLIFSAAQVAVLHGYNQEARLLINHGLEGAGSPEIRGAFERLSKRLDARQAGAGTPVAPAAPVVTPAVR
jgi:tetratricopeptide (TPR) repeat protein